MSPLIRSLRGFVPFVPFLAGFLGGYAWGSPYEGNQTFTVDNGIKQTFQTILGHTYFVSLKVTNSPIAICDPEPSPLEYIMNYLYVKATGQLITNLTGLTNPRVPPTYWAPNLSD